MKDIIVRLQGPASEDSAKAFSIRLAVDLLREPTRYIAPKKLLVVPAYPGQFGTFRHLLYRTKAIDASGRWSFGDGHVVVLGGGLCQAGEPTQHLWFIYSMAGQAAAAGGRLQFLPGLRELDALHGDWRFAHPQYATTKKERIAINALYNGNNALWQWLCQRNFMVKIGRLLITQCAIPQRTDGLDLSIQSLNHFGRLYYTQPSLLAHTPAWSAFFGGPQNPFLFSGYTNGAISDLEFSGLLKKLRVDRMITAQPEFGAETGFFRKRMINFGFNPKLGDGEAIIFKRNQLLKVEMSGPTVTME